MSHQTPSVSAVIPTRNRPQLVLRAVESVLSQTVTALECIVVIDGPDPLTEQSLRQVNDCRLRILALPENVGGCEARNAGARAARGQWVALLDDDDEWLPHRLEQQLAAVARSAAEVTMVASRFLDRGTSSQDELVRPHIFPREGQPISEFLWCEVSPLGGIAGFPQTSTWLLRRDLLLELPFTMGLKMLQDLDWLLRSYHHPRTRVLFVEEPLTIFHNDHARGRVAKRTDWQHSFEWAMRNRQLFTRKAFGFFLVVDCINRAAQQGLAWPELSSLLRHLRRYGKLTPKLVFLCFLYVCVYPSIGKVLSPRKRATMLYQVRSLARRSNECFSSFRS